MFRYFMKRLLVMLFSFWAVITVTFVAGRVAPGNPFTVGGGCGDSMIDREYLAQLEHEYGYDLPVWRQYFRYAKEVWQSGGEFGRSFSAPTRTMVQFLFDEYSIDITVKLGFFSVIFAMIYGIGLGWLMAKYKTCSLDYWISGIMIFIIAIPYYKRATLVHEMFMRFFPIGDMWGWKYSFFLDLRRYLPGFFYLIISIGSMVARQARMSFINVLSSDFIRTAKAKGLPEDQIVLNHALVPALMPLIGNYSHYMKIIICGAPIAERCFSVPGITRKFLYAAKKRDYASLIFMTTFTFTMLQFCSMVLDLVQMYLDPRLHEEIVNPEYKR